jgi:hypothetical protein
MHSEAEMKLLFSAGLVAGGLILATSCYVRDESPPPPMTPAAGSGVLTRDQAATALGEARCDHEAKCNAVGPNSPYESRGHCLSVLGRDSWLSLANCPYGIKARELSSCTNEIRNQACGGLTTPIDWFTRAVTCQSNNICLR